MVRNCYNPCAPVCVQSFYTPLPVIGGGCCSSQKSVNTWLGVGNIEKGCGGYIYPNCNPCCCKPKCEKKKSKKNKSCKKCKKSKCRC